MLRRWLFAILFCCGTCLGQEAPQSKTFRVPTPIKDRLENGLEIVWFEDATLPIVDFAVFIKSGNRADPPGRSGTCELMGQLLQRGAAGMDAQEMSRQVERIGASRYINIDEDTITIGIHGLSQDSKELLRWLSQVVISPDFVPAEYEREKRRMLDNWEHLGDFSQNLAALAFHRAVASGTSYARGPLFSKKEFASIRREDVVAHHRGQFVPENALLLVVGKAKREVLFPEIRNLFQGWSGKFVAVPAKAYSAPFLPVNDRVVIVNRPGLSQAQVRMGFPAPSVLSPDHYALTVANALLGEFFNSRLNALLRDKLGLTYAISSNLSYSKEFGSFSVSSSTRNEAVGELIDRIEEVIANLKKGPISVEEVETAKEYLKGSFPLSLSTFVSVASHWVSGQVFNLGPDYLERYIPKIDKITPADVQSAVRRHFDLKKMVIVVAGEAKEISRSIARRGKRKIKLVKVEELK